MMAHLSDDSLPTEFDVIVQGTGLIESILAGALARCGKSVLHLDKNGFYGELWASLMHKEMQEWMLNQQDKKSSCKDGILTVNKEDGILTVNKEDGILTVNKEDGILTVNKEDGILTVNKEDGILTVNKKDGILTVNDSPGQVTNLVQLIHEQSEEGCEIDASLSQLSWKTLEPLKRRLVYDICPKVVACRGLLVNTLTKSGCSKYLEFKAVSRVCVYQSGDIQQVPCSRADVFESKLVSMLEKRKMMKFLSFCSDFEEALNADLANLTFKEYLATTDLTENLIQYVSMCISMTDETAPAFEGLQAAKLFLNSLGRFGNAPFLYPIFGGGEVSQAFCRYSAVFGGVYCLKRSIKALILSDGKVSGIECSNGQKISCRHVVCNASTMKSTFNVQPNVRLSRALLLANGPVKKTEEKLTLLSIPPFSAGPGQDFVVRALQLDSSTNTAVPGTYMVHLTCRSFGANARQDLEPVAQLLYKFQDGDAETSHVLWSVYFNLDMCNIELDNFDTSVNELGSLHLTSDPDATMTYEAAVQEAAKIFQKLCPDTEFFEPLPS